MIDFVYLKINEYTRFKLFDGESQMNFIFDFSFLDLYIINFQF